MGETSASTGVKNRRGAVRWPSVVALAALWCLLWSDLSVFNLLAGAVLGWLVCVMFPMPPLGLRFSLHPGALVVLVARFVVDVVVSSIEVARVAVSPRARTVRNAIIAVPLSSTSDVVLTVVAQMTSLIPGSVVVEARRSTRTLYLHVLDIRSTEDAERFREQVLAQERRVIAAIGAGHEERQDARPAGDTTNGKDSW